MAKTVTIPSENNPFTCKINGVVYSYPAGATVSVPDEVAALIEDIKGNDPPETVPAAPAMPRGGAVNDVLTRTSAGAEWKAPATPASELPTVSGSDNGKVLKVVEGAWAAASGGGSSGIMVVTDNSTSLNKTWQEIHDAMASGTFVIILFANEELHSVETYLVEGCFTGGGDDPYAIHCLAIESAEVRVTVYYATTANDYPVYYDGE